MSPDAGGGPRMHALVRELYPLPRSITGDAVRQTLARAAEIAPLTVTEVPTGTPVLDWTVPEEWNLRGAWIDGPDGTRVVDAADHALHVLGYSVPFHGRLTRDELDRHLHSLPDAPDLIPYRTSYYAPRWGFCLPDRIRRALPDGEYDVVMDTTLAPGHLTLGEIMVPGSSDHEVLISCHTCHPALANDNLSSLAVALEAARALADRRTSLTHRFVFAPGTIGAITWLAGNPAVIPRIVGGLAISNLGDPGGLTYKSSRRGDATIDDVARDEVRRRGGSAREFTPYGYDERQYCAPGFNLPVGLLSRTPWGEFPEYHTSADNPDFVTADALADSLDTLLAILAGVEAGRPTPLERPRPGTGAVGAEAYLNLAPHGEPQLGRRGLYSAIGGGTDGKEAELAMLWVLSLSDGDHTMADIARRSGVSAQALATAAAHLRAAELIVPLAEAPPDAWPDHSSG